MLDINIVNIVTNNLRTRQCHYTKTPGCWVAVCVAGTPTQNCYYENIKPKLSKFPLMKVHKSKVQEQFGDIWMLRAPIKLFFACSLYFFHFLSRVDSRCSVVMLQKCKMTRCQPVSHFMHCRIRHKIDTSTNSKRHYANFHRYLTVDVSKRETSISNPDPFLFHLNHDS